MSVSDSISVIIALIVIVGGLKGSSNGAGLLLDDLQQRTIARNQINRFGVVIGNELTTERKKKEAFTYIFCDGIGGSDASSSVTQMVMSLACGGRCGGGDPSSFAGMRSLVGDGVWTNNWGMMRSLGRFGERSSGVGGSMSMNISATSVGRVGIGRNIFGIFRFGIPMSGQLMSLLVSAFTVTFTFLRFC